MALIVSGIDPIVSFIDKLQLLTSIDLTASLSPLSCAKNLSEYKLSFEEFIDMIFSKFIREINNCFMTVET